MITRHVAFATVCVSVLLALLPAVGSTSRSSEAILKSGAALVPLRSVSEWLGAQVTYAGGRISVTRGTDHEELRVGSREAARNGKPVRLAQAATVIAGTTYVPLRFIAEGLGAVVGYDARNAKVIIRDGGRELTLDVSSGTDPVVLATRAFRQYLAEAAPTPNPYRGKKSICFDPSEYGWLKLAMRTNGWPVMADNSDFTGWPMNDRRFVQLLKSKGWQKGDLWFPYGVTRSSGRSVSVEFWEYNWSTTLFMERARASWVASRVEAFGEGMEDQLPHQWSVKQTGSGFRFTKVR